MADEVVNTGEYQLTQQDAVFVAERTAGNSAVDALVLAYPDDTEIQQWDEMRDSPKKSEREYAKLMLRKKARAVSARRGVKVLSEKFQERVARLGEIAFDVIEEIMIEGSSEKVRGDMAIEMVRQNVGNPDKDKGSSQNVVIMIGTDPSQQVKTSTVIDGEVADG